MKNLLNENIKLSLNYQSKTGYDSLIQTVILKEIVKLMGATIVDVNIELKMKIRRINYLEGYCCNVCMDKCRQ